MGLSEDEIEARLAGLRRQREALDREIADLVLYLELGRRLGGAGRGAPSLSPVPSLVSSLAPTLAPGVSAGPGRAPRSAPESPEAAGLDFPVPSDTGPPAPIATGLEARAAAPRAARSVPPRREPDAIPPAIAFAEDAAGARRYGRALVAAACGAILAAGRPLHAGEILAILLARGFTLPGRDPVAALNTRLWKRAGPDGCLRRVAEATYALAGEVDARSGGIHAPDA